MSAAKKALANVPPSAWSIGTNAAKASVGSSSVFLDRSKFRGNIAKGKDETNDPAASTKNIEILAAKCARRVITKRPTMSAEEMHGLAFRLELIGKNGSVSAAIVAPDQYNNGRLSSMNYVDPDIKARRSLDFPLNPYKIDDCFTGLDHLQIRKQKLDEPGNQDELLYCLNGISSLTKACNTMQKAPVVTVSNGAVTDGGYALCMGRYVVATENTRFSITTPSKGLAFDPVGFSFVLNRLGRDYKQPSAKYGRAMGRILALTGYQIDRFDMVSTGLATHLGTWGALDLARFEDTLGSVHPYEDQVQWSKSRSEYQPLPIVRGRYVMGPMAETFRKRGKEQPPRFLPENRSFDAALASALECQTDGTCVGGGLMAACDNSDLNLGRVMESSLMSYAATFQSVLERDSVAGIMDGLEEARDLEGADDDYKHAAKQLLDGMKSASPLALQVIFRLLQLGRTGRRQKQKQPPRNGGRPKIEEPTLENCMEFERQVQKNMFRTSDYQNWADAQIRGQPKEFSWTHKHVGEVSQQELDDILELDD